MADASITDLSGKKIKLVIVTNNVYAFGGGEKWALELSKRLSGVFDITIVNVYSKKEKMRKTKEDLEKEYGLRDFRILDLEASQLKSSAFGKEEYTMRIPNPKSIKLLFDIIKSSDVIYEISLNPVVFSYSIVFSKILGKKFIFGIHNPVFFKIFEDNRLESRILLQLLKRVRYFHIINSSDFRLIRRHFPEARRYKIGIFLTKNRIKSETYEKKFIALYVGRFAKDQKGIDFFDRIIRKVISKEKRIEFHIVGAGGDGERIISDLSKKYEANVKALGFLDEKRLEEEYRKANIFVLPSRYEGLPAVVIEAQSYGLPVAAFDVKGPKDIVINKVQGTLIEPFDTDAFSRSILRYFQLWKSDVPEYARLKEEISEIIYNRYEVSKILKLMEKMILEVYNSK